MDMDSATQSQPSRQEPTVFHPTVIRDGSSQQNTLPSSAENVFKPIQKGNYDNISNLYIRLRNREYTGYCRVVR